MKQYPMRLRRDGVIEWLSPPPGFNIPVLKQTKTRFSEIIPVNPFLHLAFRVLRLCFGEYGRVGNWTRTWTVVWRCSILLGPGKGRTKESGLRSVLINWEHDQWAMNLRNQ
jgi:hypothetical protein